MKILLIMFILTALIIPAPAYSGMVGTPDSVEKNLQDVQKSESLRMTDDFKKDMQKPDQQPALAKSSGSNWWKWALGVLVVGGVAAAAGGGKGGSSSGSSSGSGGTVVSTW